jgi:anaerobic magnesium-protoporphyrin IX monomethyl ester cyclase
MKHITVIDLNNFSFYPTMSVGYLSSYIRGAGYDLKVLSPLSQGIKTRKREKVETRFDYFISRIRFSNLFIIQLILNYLKKVAFLKVRFMGKQRIFDYVKSTIDYGTDLVLISTYTENYSVCKKIAKLMHQKGIRVMVGGPGFNERKSVLKFVNLPGVDLVIGAEVDDFFADFLQDFFNENNIYKYPGIYDINFTEINNDYILKDIESLPIPDYSDFPWNKYPFKVIPYMTARGCSWGKCNFCTDVMYVNGRSFRSLSTKKILHELLVLSNNLETNVINFIDIKLNSNVNVWNDLIEQLPQIISNPTWFCSVHVDKRERNGLDKRTLKKAKDAGLTRISFGLESGSQRLLDHMQKGTTVEKLEQFVQDVFEVGISLRATMFLGYLNEKDEDLKETYEFLKRNSYCFDRIKIGKFQAFEMAPIFKEIKENHQQTKIFDGHLREKNKGKNYNYYKTKIIKLVYQINKRGLTDHAVKYDGVM